MTTILIQKKITPPQPFLKMTQTSFKKQRQNVLKTWNKRNIFDSETIASKIVKGRTGRIRKKKRNGFIKDNLYIKGVNEQDEISKEHFKNVRRKREKFVIKAKLESAKRNRQDILSVPECEYLSAKYSHLKDYDEICKPSDECESESESDSESDIDSDLSIGDGVGYMSCDEFSCTESDEDF